MTQRLNWRLMLEELGPRIRGESELSALRRHLRRQLRRYGGGEPYGEEGVAVADGEEKAKPVAAAGGYVPLPPPESELAHSAERSRAERRRAAR